MGLYLTIFQYEEELDGVEIGAYADFSAFRSAVAAHVESGAVGSVCPTLMLHSDCDGQWTPEESEALLEELATIRVRLERLQPEPLAAGWKVNVAETIGLRPANLYECFFDVDGEPLIERLERLAHLSVLKGLPILFQ